MSITHEVSIQEIKQRFGIIGTHPALDRAIEKAAIVASTDISVLVSGESGVGKENIPRIIHMLSARKHRPYIAVNCGAIPEGTIESELFGHEKGAVTGASGARKGYFEVADGGTIFLDEVGELPLMTQVRLLRVLETGEFMKVGSSVVQKTDVRVVAATNRDMSRAIHEGHFREDLYYRLNTVEINLPPLRNRKEDIHMLFRRFAADFAERYKMPPVRLSPDAVELLESYHWPGNVRQLRNFTEEISIMESNKYVDATGLSAYLPDITYNASHLPSTISRSRVDADIDIELLKHQINELRGEINDIKRLLSTFMGATSTDAFQGSIIGNVHRAALPAYIGQQEEHDDEDVENYSISPEKTIIDISHIDKEEEEEGTFLLEKNEIQMIRLALEKHRGRRKDAARELGISERTLYRKIKQYDLDK